MAKDESQIVSQPERHEVREVESCRPEDRDSQVWRKYKPQSAIAEVR
jgi:hypothetical protein